MKKGFTLAELMIALVILGTLCAIAVPAFFQNLPNQNKVMIKKSYYTLEQVVYVLINDDKLYPETSGYVGFDYITTDETSYKYAKLPYYFAKQINKKKRITETLSAFSSGSTYKGTTEAQCIIGSSCYRLVTSNNIVYTFPTNQFFTQNNKNSYILLGIDVNGDRGPNCYQGSDSCSTKTDNFDQYMVRLYADGRIKVRCEDQWARASISLDSKQTGDKEDYEEITCNDDYYGSSCKGTCTINGTNRGTMTIEQCQALADTEEACGSNTSFSNTTCGTLDVPECSNCFAITDNGVCVSDVITSYEPIDTCNGTNEWDKNYTYNVNPTGCSTNYWAGAKRYCEEELDMKLPDYSILDDNWTGKPTSGYFWSSADSDDHLDSACTFDFSAGGDYGCGADKNRSGYKVLCVGK